MACLCSPGAHFSEIPSCHLKHRLLSSPVSPCIFQTALGFPNGSLRICHLWSSDAFRSKFSWLLCFKYTCFCELTQLFILTVVRFSFILKYYLRQNINPVLHNCGWQKFLVLFYVATHISKYMPPDFMFWQIWHILCHIWHIWHIYIPSHINSQVSSLWSCYYFTV